MNLFKNVFALALFALTLLVLRDDPGALREYSSADFGILVVSGILGIAAADTFFFRSLDLIGVGITSIVDCLYSPLVIFFAHVLLAEELAFHQYLGTGLIVGAVLISSRHPPPADRTRGQIVFGIVLAVVSMVLMTFGIVIAKPVLDGKDFPLLWATAIRMLSGVLVLMVVAQISPHRKKYWSVFKPSRIWRVSIPASFLGGYLALLCWMAGFKYAKASIAGVLNQTSVIFAILLASWILKEKLTRRKLLAVIIAMAGVGVVTL